ncbi:pantothenate synthetase [Planoprotostelium fungivorum]|uniref:Pantoate--beta-alanine ligase n=1 Tax=Planoprotostelium fungivorum TaxID=1890364 RepID=A0A2P6NY84_9EUKA|nr:pantothenate synthetase [Planoprotostelium fungivorum]
MQVVNTIKQLRTLRATLAKNNKSVGLVPTMGYLHQGHLSLVREAKRKTDAVGVTIFVNPLQFGPTEDFTTYPRAMERDLDMLRSENVDFVFCPTPEEMYPTSETQQEAKRHLMLHTESRTWVQVEGMDELTREGSSRKGHFRGVATVVTKLFNIVQPDKAFFGQKDGMQCIVIKKMVNDLNVPVEIDICDTMREEDGLAMSSRNVYLNPQQRAIAPTLYRALQCAARSVHEGERRVSEIVRAAEEEIRRCEGLVLDYIVVSDMNAGVDLDRESRVEDNTHLMISGAMWNGKTRLIDNIVLQL